MRKALDDVFAQVYVSFKDDAYYKNFAPSFLEMQKQLNERNYEVEKLRQKLSELETFKEKVDQWKQGDYVDFEEV